jgi:ATP-dependent DNA helicase 2 subunit 2
MFHSAVVADLTTNPVPPPHPELVKYFDPPHNVLKRASRAIEECKQIFKVKQGRYIHAFADSQAELGAVPTKVVRIRKDEHVHARDEDEDMLLLDKIPYEKTETQLRNHVSNVSQEEQSLVSPPKQSTVVPENDSDTEDEDEELLLDQSVSKKSETPSHPLPTPSRSPSPEGFEIDPRRAPGRIVGSAFPLQDFKRNLAEGDVVSKAVEDLAFVIRDVVKKPFASRRYREMVECMRELRDVCLKVWPQIDLVIYCSDIDLVAGRRNQRLERVRVPFIGLSPDTHCFV